LASAFPLHPSNTPTQSLRHYHRHGCRSHLSFRYFQKVGREREREEEVNWNRNGTIEARVRRSSASAARRLAPVTSRITSEKQREAAITLAQSSHHHLQNCQTHSSILLVLRQTLFGRTMPILSINRIVPGSEQSPSATSVGPNEHGLECCQCLGTGAEHGGHRKRSPSDTCRQGCEALKLMYTAAGGNLEKGGLMSR
jgi:hypothetical protein